MEHTSLYRAGVSYTHRGSSIQRRGHFWEGLCNTHLKQHVLLHTAVCCGVLRSCAARMLCAQQHIGMFTAGLSLVRPSRVLLFAPVWLLLQVYLSQMCQGLVRAPLCP